MDESINRLEGLLKPLRRGEGPQHLLPLLPLLDEILKSLKAASAEIERLKRRT